MLLSMLRQDEKRKTRPVSFQGLILEMESCKHARQMPNTATATCSRLT